MIPSLALCVRGEFVLTTMPGCTGQAHDATGFGDLSTSTKHIRQLPAIINFLRDVSSGLRDLGSQLLRLTHGNNIYIMSDLVTIIINSHQVEHT